MKMTYDKLTEVARQRETTIASLREDLAEAKKRLQLSIYSDETERKARINLTDECASLRERLHKCEGMANEINILTKENNRLTRELEAERGKVRDIVFVSGDIFIGAGRMADTLYPVLILFRGEPGEIGRDHDKIKKYTAVHPDDYSHIARLIFTNPASLQVFKDEVAKLLTETPDELRVIMDKAAQILGGKP